MVIVSLIFRLSGSGCSSKTKTYNHLAVKRILLRSQVIFSKADKEEKKEKDSAIGDVRRTFSCNSEFVASFGLISLSRRTPSYIF